MAVWAWTIREDSERSEEMTAIDQDKNLGQERTRADAKAVASVMPCSLCKGAGGGRSDENSGKNHQFMF